MTRGASTTGHIPDRLPESARPPPVTGRGRPSPPPSAGETAQLYRASHRSASAPSATQKPNKRPPLLLLTMACSILLSIGSILLSSELPPGEALKQRKKAGSVNAIVALKRFKTQPTGETDSLLNGTKHAGQKRAMGCGFRRSRASECQQVGRSARSILCRGEDGPQTVHRVGRLAGRPQLRSHLS